MEDDKEETTIKGSHFQDDKLSSNDLHFVVLGIGLIGVGFLVGEW